MTRDDAAVAAVPWQKRDPKRWRRELAALRRAGLFYRIRRTGTRVWLLISYPVPAGLLDGDDAAGDTVALEVHFSRVHPFLPPTVVWLGRPDALGRHLNPVDLHLCLIHEADWDMGMTVARLLVEQMPKVFATNGLLPAG